MNFKKLTLAMMAVSSLTLVGCTNPFDSNSSSPTLTIDPPKNSTGSAFDWYIKGATVFADFNEKDGIRQTTEPQTTSNDDGLYNLEVPANLGTNYVVVVKGGTDIATGVAFNGVLKAGPDDTMASPATTLREEFKAAGVSDPDAAVKTFLGLPPTANLGADPAKNADLYVAATKATAVINSLASAVTVATGQTSTTASLADLQRSISLAVKSLAEAVKTNETADVADKITFSVEEADLTSLVSKVNEKVVANLVAIQETGSTTINTTALTEQLNTTLSTSLKTVVTAAASSAASVATKITSGTSIADLAADAKTAQEEVISSVSTSVEETAKTTITETVEVVDAPTDEEDLTGGTGGQS